MTAFYFIGWSVICHHHNRHIYAAHTSIGRINEMKCLAALVVAFAAQGAFVSAVFVSGNWESRQVEILKDHFLSVVFIFLSVIFACLTVDFTFLTFSPSKDTVMV
jgi:hypothetical protein